MIRCYCSAVFQMRCFNLGDEENIYLEVLMSIFSLVANLFKWYLGDYNNPVDI